METFNLLLFASLSLTSGTLARADTFVGLNTFDIEFVRISNLGNAADTTSYPNPG